MPTAVKLGLSFVMLLLLAPGCSNRDKDSAPPTNSVSNTSKSELILLVDLDYSAPIGYGHAWKASVKEVRAGTLADKSVSLRTFLDESSYGGVISCCEPASSLLIGFRRLSSRPAALSGFAAVDGSIWEIESVRRSQ